VPPSRAPDTLEWDEIQEDLRRAFLGLSRGAEPADIDDLVQEASVRLLRIVRREKVREMGSLLPTLARRTWYDYLRRVIRARERANDPGEQQEIAGQLSPGWNAELGDPAERLALVVQEFFVGRGARECLDMLRHFLSAASWELLARQKDVEAATLRKRWSRCLAQARTGIAGDEDLSPWLD
jgi:DNA-directed RNA polymerase specialized sigma24 family protein